MSSRHKRLRATQSARHGRELTHVLNERTVARIVLLAHGKVFLVRRRTSADLGVLYAMKVKKVAAILKQTKTAEHIKTEGQVLGSIRKVPFLVSFYCAFRSDAKLDRIMAVCVWIESSKGGGISVRWLR